MTEMEEVTILQISPAGDWWAVYGTSEGEEFSSPLVCWALVEGRDGKRQVAGIDADPKGTVEIAAYANNFKRYEYRGVGVAQRGEVASMPPEPSIS